MSRKRKTYRWHQRLTKAMTRHLREHMHTFTLRDFRELRAAQRDMAERQDMDIWRVCPECEEIERRLINCGHLTDPKEKQS